MTHCTPGVKRWTVARRLDHKQIRSVITWNPCSTVRRDVQNSVCDKIKMLKIARVTKLSTSFRRVRKEKSQKYAHQLCHVCTHDCPHITIREQFNGFSWKLVSKVSLKSVDVESSWNLMAHGDAREGKWRGNWRMEWVASTLTLPRNMMYPALLPLMRTTRLPAVDWTNAPADLNGLVRFAERPNLVSARVPSHFKRSLHSNSVITSWKGMNILCRYNRGVYCYG